LNEHHENIMNQASETILDLVTHADSIMLVTAGTDGMLAARPMRLAKAPVLEEFWFVTARDSSQAKDIEDDIRAAVTTQQGRKHASVSGMATLVSDRAVLEELWTPMLRPWFPDGPSDPSMVAIKFVPMKAEVWDGSGLRGFTILFESVKAILKGQAVELDDAGVHDAVSF